jgi:hypothetical protein
MRLAPTVVGLADPLSDLVVELVLVPEHELVDPIRPVQMLPLHQSRRVGPSLEPEAADEAVLPEPDDACEPHPTMNAMLDFVGTCSDGPNSPASETQAS